MNTYNNEQIKIDEKISSQFEEAIQETATGKMDEIVKSHDKFQTVTVLMDLLCKELKIQNNGDLDALCKAIVMTHQEHTKAMIDFGKLTGGKVQKAFKDAVNQARK